MRVEIMISIALLALIAVCLFLATGCTSTHIKYGELEFNRTSFMQRVDCRAGVIDGEPYIIYSNDGGAETGGKVVGGAVKTIVR